MSNSNRHNAGMQDGECARSEVRNVVPHAGRVRLLVDTEAIKRCGPDATRQDVSPVAKLRQCLARQASMYSPRGRTAPCAT